MDETVQRDRHVVRKAAVRVYGVVTGWLDSLGRVGQRNILEQFRRLDQEALEEAEEGGLSSRDRSADW